MTLYDRPRLGRIFQEHKITNDQKQSADSKPKTVYCGSYERNSTLHAKIIIKNSINRFYFKTNCLTSDELSLMRTTTAIKYSSGSPMYQARPYTTDIGQIKILFSNQVKRCKILDLYTVSQRFELKLRASVLLIDCGTVISVAFEELYDPPQFINYLKDIEPEAKPCRLSLGNFIPNDSIDKQINTYCCERIRSCPNKEYIVKILDYQEDLYLIDILDNKDISLLEHLKTKFHSKLKDFHEKEEIENDSCLGFYEPTPFFNLPHKRRKQTSVNGTSNMPRNYLSVIQYFKDKTSRARMSLKESEMPTGLLKKMFFKVKVLGWYDPESLFIVPDDPEYTEQHDEFVKDLAKYQHCNEENFDPMKSKVFRLGETCLFKNNMDPKLGKWLRGVVVAIPHVNETLRLTTNNSSCNMAEEVKIHILYKVESIDYGFQVVVSHSSLRRPTNKLLFTKRGPWALKCRLFGINPLDSDIDEDGQRAFSRACLSSLDFWIREKTLDNGRFAFFHILLRSDLTCTPNYWISSKPVADVTLFHRWEPPYTIDDCMLPNRRRSRFDCINTHLILSGVAGDYIHDIGRSSNVNLDHYIVNLLVRHDKI